jgi:hypothetical protein
MVEQLSTSSQRCVAYAFTFERRHGSFHAQQEQPEKLFLSAVFQMKRLDAKLMA